MKIGEEKITVIFARILKINKIFQTTKVIPEVLVSLRFYPGYKYGFHTLMVSQK